MGQVKTLTLSGATVTNTGTGTATAQFDGGYNQVSLVAKVTKTSGTLGGTATLQGSLDGTNYVTIPTATVVGGASTYTVTDTATQYINFVVTGSPYKYYRLSWTGTGTMVGVISDGYIRGTKY